MVDLPDGDGIVLHDDCPTGWEPGMPMILFVHGLSGCHGSPYMIRLANRFFKAGYRAFRMDMRGCGAAWALSKGIGHAGRSDDVMAGLSRAASVSGSGPMFAMGVSLGGNQLLRALGRVGAGADARPEWFGRMKRAAAIAPPVDLVRCSENMQRFSRRLYNTYFIRHLIQRVPKLVKQRNEFQELIAGRRPKTLLELDNRFTAPISGFVDAKEYYECASARDVVSSIDVETLVVAAGDDPIVPIDCFESPKNPFSEVVRLLISDGGGHNGFLGPDRGYWIEDLVSEWFPSKDGDC